ncbi:nudix hydrolase 8-like [Rutidosis leptorrhynchoides]|uniref:nudix hydrolase 8-like n=1 Tax=Rutidosis leptorrhynchoides TaxID=125765 RepID=UPI003A98EB26
MKSFFISFVDTMNTMSTIFYGSKVSSFSSQHFEKQSRHLWSKDCGFHSPSRLSMGFMQKPPKMTTSFSRPFFGGGLQKRGVHVLSPDLSTQSFALEILAASDDEYNGVIIDPEILPSSSNAFASALRTSLSIWKLKGKKGVWLKILSELVNLVPIAIQEGFEYHHAEAGYVMLTYWIPDDEQRTLPSSPCHQIGIGAFVINDQRQVLVVKEKCPCRCSNVWKLPTGYLNKSEDIFSGAIREVKEETGVDTVFLEMIAFRHAHRLAFEQSDLMFVCMLKPLSTEITIDDKELQAAKWLDLDEFVEQPFYVEDEMTKRVIDICVVASENHYCNGFVAHQLTSKLDDGKLSYLYHGSQRHF